jgi:hypothetical protein
VSSSGVSPPELSVVPATVDLDAVSLSKGPTVREMTYHCPTCQGTRVFEQPPCADGHGADCPEWACVDCGTALLVDMVLERAEDREVAARVA